ncbi:MAG TPA: VOC family protein [Candidatus Limnocylindria bacterium]|jgi:catechol 2,3-dioxygenase-like lactoylglutathione lyase family enzyme
MNGRFHHMDIYVADLDRTVGFWGPLLEAIGWSAAAVRPTVRSWRGAGTELFFVQAEPEFVAQGYHRKRVGLNHLALAVDGRAELTRFRDLVVTRGARMLYGGEIEETATQHRFFFEDPDRIKVEVLAER